MHRRSAADDSGSAAGGERPLPPIPERSDSKPEQEECEDKSEESSGKPAPRRRAGSFFEGASKYEILLYLRDAKDRIGYTDFEIDVENDELEQVSKRFFSCTDRSPFLKAYLHGPTDVSKFRVIRHDGVVRHDKKIWIVKRRLFLKRMEHSLGFFPDIKDIL
jgi:hypothetical protein